MGKGYLFTTYTIPSKSTPREHVYITQADASLLMAAVGKSCTEKSAKCETEICNNNLIHKHKNPHTHCVLLLFWLDLTFRNEFVGFLPLYLTDLFIFHSFMNYFPICAPTHYHWNTDMGEKELSDWTGGKGMNY